MGSQEVGGVGKPAASMEVYNQIMSPQVPFSFCPQGLISYAGGDSSAKAHWSLEGRSWV